MLKKPEARKIIDGLKERGFIRKSVINEIEKDISIYLKEEKEWNSETVLK